ncbi:hypothetical protein NMG60_11009863 [Bertholletia excelsa]
MKKSLRMLLVLAVLLALAMTILGEEMSPEGEDDAETPEDEEIPFQESPEATSLRGTSRLLAQTSRANMKCNKYPRICHVKGSPGPDCCNKKCVNVKTDRLNCGYCGKKCKYSEICCKGKCVNPMNDKKNCGGCGTKCKKGNRCTYGMCSYA